MKTDSSACNPHSRRLGLEAFASHYGLRFVPDLLEEDVLHPPAPSFPTSLRSVSLRRDPETFTNQNEKGEPELRSEVRLMERFAHMWPFREGFLKHVKNLAFGSYAGLDWTIFDYGYGLHAESPMIATCGVVCARLPVNLPSLHLSPESFLHRVECKLCVHELTMECREFNDQYFVRAANAREAFDILHPRAIEYLLSLPKRDWQIRGCQVVLAQRSVYAVEELSKVMEEIDGFVRLIPGYVREDRGVVPDWKGPFG